jgi:von Willebrand factor type A domain
VRSRLILIPLMWLVSCVTRPEAPPPPDGTPSLRLELPEQLRSSVPLAEFRGRVEVNELSGADVVFVIDLTNTTLEATGVDSNENGVVGVDRPWANQNTRSDVRWQRPARTWTSDFGDAIVSVELESTKQLVRALAERNCRVGIVTFTGKARVLAELGPPEAALQALERLKVRVDRTGTLPKVAFQRAGRMLDEAQPDRGLRRRPVVVFLSDGCETNYNQEGIRRDAERSATELAERGISVHTLGFGDDEAKDPTIMGRIAAFGHGLYLHVDHAREAVGLVAPKLTISELPVTNRSDPTASPRAVRSFADGSFDGFVPLVPGDNTIEIEAVLADGRRARASQILHYEPTTDPQPSDAELLSALRDRTAETELAGESQVGSNSRRTTLEIRGEPAPGRDSQEHAEPQEQR